MDPVLVEAEKDGQEHVKEAARDLIWAQDILDEDLSDWKGDEFYNELVVENAVHALSLAYRSLDKLVTDEGAWSIWRIGQRGRAIRDEALKRIRENLVG